MFGGILQRLLLKESATPENVTKAMDNHSYVIINYKSDEKDIHTGSRVIQPFAYGLTKNGNPVLRAFQPYGDTNSTTPSWKLFRLDRISYWEETSRTFNDLPDEKYGIINSDGDKSMATVIKSFSSTIKTDATNGVNIGPKTKEKIYARTKGDDTVKLGNKNLQNQKNSIYIDIANNEKTSNGFNITTQPSSQSTNQNGPKLPNEPTQDNINGSVKDGDISQKELDKARKQVYSNNITDDMWNELTKWSDNKHKFTDDEWEQAMFDQSVMNRENWQNKDLSTSRRKFDRENSWQKRADNSFLGNRADSGNRELYYMDLDDEDL